MLTLNTLRPKQHGCHFTDDTFNRIFLNEHVRIAIAISLKFVPEGPNNNIPALVQIMAWRRPGDKPLSEPMMVRLLTHICGIRPQWVKVQRPNLLSWLLMLWQHKEPGHPEGPIQNMSTLFQVMTWHLCYTKLLFEPMMTYRQMDPYEQTLVKSWIKMHIFSFKYLHSRMSSAKCQPYCSGLSMLPYIKAGWELLCNEVLWRHCTVKEYYFSLR